MDLDDVFVRLERNPVEDEDPRNWGKASKAVVACTGNGHGAVLWTAGPHVQQMIDDCSAALDELGLDDAPEGISVWEGKLEGGRSGYYGDDYDCELRGAFRDPTEEEWSAIRRGECPWSDEDWMLRA